jgi:CHRD domain
VIFRNSKLVLVLVALAVAALAVPALSQGVRGTVEVQAKLKGNTEVPGPGSKKGKGDVHIELKAKKKKVCFELEVARLDEVTAGHIHKGTADVAGDVVVLLFEDTSGLAGTGSYEGCTKGVKKKLIKRIGKKPDRYYVNIHTNEFPDGAIRGQLEPVK